MYMYVHIFGHYNFSVWFTIYFLTPSSFMSGETYSSKSISKDRFLWNVSMAILFTHRVFARKLLKSPKKYFFIHISFCSKCMILCLNYSFMSNRPTHYLLDFGNYRNLCLLKMKRITTIHKNQSLRSLTRTLIKINFLN